MEREVTCWGKVAMIFIFKFSTRSDWPCNSYVAIKLVSIVISLMGDFGSLVDLFSIAFTKTDCCLHTGQILLEHTHEFYSFWNVHSTMSNYSSTRLLEKRHECSRLFYVLGTLVMSVMTILGGFTSAPMAQWLKHSSCKRETAASILDGVINFTLSIDIGAGPTQHREWMSSCE